MLDLAPSPTAHKRVSRHGKRVRLPPGERRTSILEAAAWCFAKGGFRNTTMQDVANKASISVGAVYRYFVSKDELVTEIIRQSYADAQRVFSGISEARPVGEAVMDLFVNLPEGEAALLEAALFAEISAESFRNPQVEDALRRGESDLEKMLASNPALVASSDLQNSNISRAAATVIIAALHDGLMLRAPLPSDCSKDELLAAVDIVIKALLQH